jgi:hypothetical protein
LLASVRLHIDHPPLPGIIGTRRGHHRVCPRLHAHHIVIPPDCHRVAPPALIHRQPTMVESHLAVLPDGPRELAEASGPPQAQRVEGPAVGLPQHDLRGESRDAAVGLLACRRPRAPQRIIPHTVGVPLRHLLALGAPHDRGIEPAARDGQAAFGALVPRMALRGRRPLASELAETRGARHTHRPLLTDHGLRGTPRRQRVPQDGEET